MQNYFDDEDLPFLLANYEKYSAECQRVIMGKTAYLSLFEGKHPRFAYTAANKRILDAFLQKGWISSYDLGPDNKYRAYGKKDYKNGCNYKHISRHK